MNQHITAHLDQIEAEISAGKRVYGIFGSPIEHSLSPLMHNTAFALKSIGAVYFPFRVKKKELKNALESIRDAGVSGLNITLPLKEAIREHVDELTPAARKTGAVNTLVIKGDYIKGYNTDLNGFKAPLSGIAEPLKYENVVVFGGGGAARTVLYALLSGYSFPRLTLITRNAVQGNRLLDEAEGWKKHQTMLEWADFNDTRNTAEIIWDSRLLVNCTPLGMKDMHETFPERLTRFFRPGQVAYDLIYIPLKTPFLQAAERRGLHTISGLSMFVEQGAKAFRIWTGKIMPKREITTMLISHLESGKRKHLKI